LDLGHARAVVRGEHPLRAMTIGAHDCGVSLLPLQEHHPVEPDRCPALHPAATAVTEAAALAVVVVMEVVAVAHRARPCVCVRVRGRTHVQIEAPRR
jgi:hypothetical protein